MTRLGQLLVRADLISENNLARALGVQHFAGGRLGTLLLERGAIHEDDLGKILAQQHGCEFAPWSVLGNVAPPAIAALPAKFAIRHSAVPYDRSESFLKVALRDPSDLRILDELFFVTGRKIIAAAAPEVRIFQALEKYYGERRTPRFAILAEKLSRVSSREAVRAASVPPPPNFFPEEPAAPTGRKRPSASVVAPPDAAGPAASAPTPRMPDAPLTPWAPVATSASAPQIDDESDVISWEELSPPSLWIPEPLEPALEQERPRASPRPREPVPAASPSRGKGPESQPGRRRDPAVPEQAPQPRSRPVASTAPPAPRLGEGTSLAPETFEFPGVLGARDRVRAVSETVAALAERFPRAAFFGAKPDGVSGLAATGKGVESARIPAIRIPWTEPSVFLNVRLSRSFYLGPLPPLPRHRPIAEAMGKASDECVVQPVWIKEKPVAFLYAEFDPDRGATPMDLAYLRSLAAASASALAASIRSRKGG